MQCVQRIYELTVAFNAFRSRSSVHTTYSWITESLLKSQKDIMILMSVSLSTCEMAIVGIVRYSRLKIGSEVVTWCSGRSGIHQCGQEASTDTGYLSRDEQEAIILTGQVA